MELTLPILPFSVFQITKGYSEQEQLIRLGLPDPFPGLRPALGVSQYGLDPALGVVQPKFRFPIPLGVGGAFRIVAEALPEGHAGLVELSLLGDDLFHYDSRTRSPR